jgi:hypothetical protein
MQSHFLSRTRLVLLALAAVAALAIAGCGGDDDTTDATTAATGASGVAGAPLTQEEFVSQGNQICGDVNDQLNAMTAPSNDLGSIAQFASDGLAIIEPALAQFQAITPPADLQSKWDDFLSKADQQIELTKQMQAAAEAGDKQQVKDLLGQIQAMDDDGALAKELGLDVCAQETSPQG